MQDQTGAIWQSDWLTDWMTGQQICVWACLKTRALTNVWLLRRDDKHRHTSVVEFGWHVETLSRKVLIAKLQWRSSLLLWRWAGWAISHLWFSDAVMEMETEFGSWAGTCQRWHRYPAWCWWPADSPQIPLLPVCQQCYGVRTEPWGGWCYPLRMLQRRRQLPVIQQSRFGLERNTP